MNKNLSQSNDALQNIQNANQNEIIYKSTFSKSSVEFYSLNETDVKIEVLFDSDTVWLNRQQLSVLFGRDIKTIGKHINNALHEELLNCSVVANFATTATDGKKYNVEYYNLEVITSVGYRVKSKQGVLFRHWANKVLKEYLLRGYAVNQRINQLEDKIDRRFADYDLKIENLNQQVDFFVKTSLPPKEKVFFDGQLFDAHILMSQLVESAEKRILKYHGTTVVNDPTLLL